MAKAFYGVVNEVIEGLELKEEPSRTGLRMWRRTWRCRLMRLFKQRLMVDWRVNPDVQNEMRNAIDDLLYEAKAKQGVPLSTEDMDAIIERSLDIAKNRYAK